MVKMIIEEFEFWLSSVGAVFIIKFSHTQSLQDRHTHIYIISIENNLQSPFSTLIPLAFYEKWAMQVCFGRISVTAKAVGFANKVKLIIIAIIYFMHSQTTAKKQKFNF
jgi:hypothetical protein